MRDILPTEAAERRVLAARCRDVFESWGYGEIVTPAFEYSDVLASEAGEEISREMFRFVDSDGRLVALRPEMTTSIARAVAQRMRNEPAPHRLWYVQNVFRDEPAQRGQQREFRQAGVELIGAGGSAADMEVIATAAEALSAAGLDGFRIGIGHVGVFRSALERTGIDAAERREAEKLVTSRNLVGLKQLMSCVSTDAAHAVLALVGTRGGSDAIDKVRGVTLGGSGREALEELAETHRLLDSYGLGETVMLDFGIIRSFEYYTGVVFEAYAPGLGFPLGAGGRYDSLLAEFGAPMPAAGFAIGLERLHIAIAEEGELIGEGRGEVLVGWESDPADALAVARQLRGAGVCASVCLEATSAEELEARARERRFTAVLVSSGATKLRVMDPAKGTWSTPSVDDLVRRMSPR